MSTTETVAEKLGLDGQTRTLKIGQSFTNPKSIAFHSIKYDFKPASVDPNKMATVDIGATNQVTVTVPHSDGAGVPYTIFKGSQRPIQKECVLIIDKLTGEITIEKLGCYIQVKKTRNVNNTSAPSIGGGGSSSGSNNNTSTGSTPSGSTNSKDGGRGQTPPPSIGQRISHRTKVTSGQRRPDRPIITTPSSSSHNFVQKHSPLHASPKNNDSRLNNTTIGGSTLASLPMIAFDDELSPQTNIIKKNPSPPPPPPPPPSSSSLPQFPNFDEPPSMTQNGGIGDIGEMSDTSSSDSDSSDSDTDGTINHINNNNNNKTIIPTVQQSTVEKTNNTNTVGTTDGKMATHLLNEDLCLSESGSDSD